MTTPRFLLGAVSVLAALLLQVTVVARLPLPGAAPDVVLLLVVAFAVAEGQLSGMVTGFVAGLLADAVSDHQLGRLALTYTVVGYVCGLAGDDTDRSTLQPFGAVALGALTALVTFAAQGVLLGDERVSVHAVLRVLSSSVLYDVVLTPFVVPVVAFLVRRLDDGPARR